MTAKELIWEILPGNALKPFNLGTPLGTAIALIKEKYQCIPHVDLIYDDSEPLKSDVILDLTRNGVRLYFHPASQILTFIEITAPSLLKFMLGERQFYGTKQTGVTVSSSPQSNSIIRSHLGFEKIFDSISPCRGYQDSARSQYILTKDGIACFFDIPDRLKGRTVDLTAARRFPDGTEAVLSSVAIYSGKDFNKPSSSSFKKVSSSYGELVQVQPLRGIVFTKSHKHVEFDATVQDVLTDIGPPDATTYKNPDSMSSSQTKQDASASDYFFNYFQQGIDVLFDGKTNTVQKILLHTNYPGHYDFSIYHRCNFEITLPTAEVSSLDRFVNSDEDQRTRREFIAAQPQPTELPAVSPGRTKFDSISLDEDTASPKLTITQATKFDPELQHALGVSQDAPIILNRPPTINTVNPFEPTRLWKTSNTIFEVMSNHHIATVTLLSPSCSH